ncbi:RNA polymerase sigma factor [Gammaproteobacteria bacterium]|nr:RNA polymerase sigma factor [Gammaproteobacteria bacterium]
MEVAVREISSRVLREPKPIVTEVCKNKEVTILKEKLLETNKKLMPYALTLVNYADAEDLCQTTMMKLIENQEKFLQSNTPTAYAKTILKNAFVDNYRKQKKIVPLITESLESSYNFDASCEYEEMLRCLEKHNEIERTIIGMLESGNSYKEIQEFIGDISIANLRVKALRARKTLAECMGRKL